MRVEMDICGGCSGSGEGGWDGSRCSTCGGGGETPQVIHDLRIYEEIQRCEVGVHIHFGDDSWWTQSLEEVEEALDEEHDELLIEVAGVGADDVDGLLEHMRRIDPEHAYDVRTMGQLALIMDAASAEASASGERLESSLIRRGNGVPWSFTLTFRGRQQVRTGQTPRESIEPAVSMLQALGLLLDDGHLVWAETGMPTDNAMAPEADAA